MMQLAQNEIERLGKEFMVAVMAEDVEPTNSLESLSLLESNFTGMLVDRLGHKQYYRDGTHIAGPTAIDQTHHDHPKAPELAAQAVKLWGPNAKAKLEEAIAKNAENPDPAIQRKVMAAKVALAGLAKHHDFGDFDLGKEFAEPAKEIAKSETPTKKEESKSKSEEWTPIKSPEDAEGWAKGSTVKQTLYHGTHADVADKIKASGFQSGMSAFGMGVYLSADKSFANSYQRGVREGKGRTLEAKIDVKKMLPIKDSPQGYEAAAKLLGMSKAEFASETQKTMPSTKGSQLLAMGEVIRKAAQSQGYDGLDVDSSKPFYVVFDPKRVTTIAEQPAPLTPAPNAPPPHPESVVKAKPLGKIDDAATLDAAHDHVKKLYDSALTDDKIFEKVDAAMASLGNELTVPQLKTLAGKFGINDVRGSKADIIGSIGRKIKSRREMHDRTKAHGEAPGSSPGIDSHAAALKHAMTVNYPEDGWTRAKTDEVMKQFADLSKSDLVSIAAKSGAVKPNEEKDWNRKSAKAIREDLADILNAGVRAFERIQA